MNNLEIAKVIMDQLGGRRFTIMTGAKNVLAVDRGVSFKLPSRFAKDGINHVIITLDPSDTYTMKFLKLRGTSVQTIKEVSDVYNDQLQRIFTHYTGLDTRL